MAPATTLTLIVASLSGIAIPILLTYFNRLLRRADLTQRDLNHRLGKIEKRQGKHTIALTTMAAGLSQSMATQQNHANSLDELEDAVQQLQLATTRLREHQAASEHYRAGLASRAG